MSSVYPPYGGASVQQCQRCGVALPFNEAYCRNCGYYNTAAQNGNGTGPTSPNMSWGATPPASSGQYSQTQYGRQQWSQFPPQSSTVQNNFYDVPQVPFDMPAQQAAANNHYGSTPTGNNDNYSGGVSQLGSNYAGPSTPPQPFYPATPMAGGTNGFQPGVMN